MNFRFRNARTDRFRRAVNETLTTLLGLLSLVQPRTDPSKLLRCDERKASSENRRRSTRILDAPELHDTGNCFLKKLSGVRKTITSGVLTTITDGSFLSLQKRSAPRAGMSYRGNTRKRAVQPAVQAASFASKFSGRWTCHYRHAARDPQSEGLQQ